MIPNGVQLDRFVPPEILPEPGTFIFVGRLREQKGLHYLIDAIALLSPKEQALVRVTVVGDGPWREKLMQHAQQKGVQDHLNFVGWVERSEIPGYYQAHSGIILPSLDEGMPNVLLEAMACGLPVIGSDIAGNRDLVQGNGWLVAPAQPDQLSNALCEALNNPEQLEHMGQVSRRIAEEHSWQHVANQYLTLMQQYEG
jgi:glycosyltransferase involved in cell wall biosynthesis